MKDIQTLADVDYGRLDDLHDRLYSGEPLTVEERREIAHLLLSLHRLAMGPVDFPNLTRRPPTVRRDQARAVRTLVEEYGIANKVAARTLLPDAEDKEIDALLRAARREKWSKLPVDHQMVVAALAVLREEGRL
jgi:hypothetical protein